jgi:serine/threonine-protein kinase
MGMHIPVAARPDFILLLALTYTVVGRAIFVPSSARRTFVLTALIGIPLAITMYFVFLDEEFLRAWQSLSGEAQDATPSGFATFLAIHVSVWWSLTVFAATSASKVIYGLRREVRDAKRLGQYQLESKLGEGAMGVVYRARHALLQRPTAIKLLQPERAGEANVKRFEAEVRQTARLRHRNTVTIFDYGHTADGTFYYAMEYLDGLTLEEVVRRGGPQRPGRVLRILEQMAAALVEAHGMSLVHRDIKPANAILFLPHRYGGVADEIKLLDFGLVKELAGEGSIVLTHADAISGTPQYMAPEALTDPKHVDGRADLYAVGAVGYYLLTGESVFGGATIVEVCSHHLHTEPESPSERLGVPVPQALEDLILACLAKDRSDRPQSAGDLGHRLGRCRPSVEPWTAEDATAWWSRYGSSTSQRGTRPEPSETLLAIDRRQGQ